jgi:hypothetical protein
MKYSICFLFIAGLLLVGCGAGHANLTSVTVSPQSATTTSNPQGQLGYTATGHFANGKSRELSQVDGLSWKTSPTTTGGYGCEIASVDTEVPAP